MTLRLTRKRAPADLLVRLASELAVDRLEPEDDGTVRIRLAGRGPKAWEDVRDALDRAGPEWREWLHLGPRPSR